MEKSLFVPPHGWHGGWYRRMQVPAWACCRASLPLRPPARPCCLPGSAAHSFSILRPWKKKRLSKSWSTRVGPGDCAQKDRHISTSSPGGPPWLGMNDLQVDERRNHLVRKHFVAQFSPLPAQPWEAARTAAGTGACCKRAISFALYSLLPALYQVARVPPVTAGIRQTGPVWEGWVQGGKGLCRQ